MLFLLLWLPFLGFLGGSLFGRWLRESFLKFKFFFISGVLFFFVMLVLFSCNSLFFAFCDNESQLVPVGGLLNMDNHLVKEIVVDTDPILLEKINNLSENLKECQQKNNEMVDRAHFKAGLAVVLACLFVFMFGFELYREH